MSNQNLEVKVNAFINAVQLLFHSNNSSQKKKANKFIIDLEKNSDSWDIAFQVLQKDKLSDEVYFNALQILKNKIKFDFGNYIENPMYIQNLLNFFENNIDKFKNSETYLLINYCDCIGKAFLFTGDKFKEILIKFINKLSGQNTDIKGLLSLLLIFNSINENSMDDKIVIDKKSREQIISCIKNIAGDIFQFIIFMINKLEEDDIKNNLKLKKLITDKILETIINYINFPINEDTILKFNNDYFPIVNFIFQISQDNLQKQSECICALLEFPLYKDNMRNLSQFIFSKILLLKDIFYQSYNSLDNEQISFYIDVFTNMVQNNLKEILDEKRYDLIQIIVDLIKKCPPMKIELILQFFECLNQGLYEKNYTIQDLAINFKNIFIALIKNFISLMEFDVEIFKKLNTSKTKEFKNDDIYNDTMDYRHFIQPFFEDFCLNYGFNFIFNEIIYPEFNIIILNIKQNQKDISLWCKLENILYSISCIMRVINIKEKEKNEKIFDNLNIVFYTAIDIPKEFVQIVRTITRIIEDSPEGLFSEKDLLLKCFKYLVDGLNNKLLLKYCSRSAKTLLNKNKKIMSEFKIDLMSLYNEKLKNNVLLNDKYIDIIEGLIEVICYSENNNSNNTNDDIIKKCIVEIMKPWVLYFKEAKKLFDGNNNSNNISKDNYKSLNNLLIILKYTSRSIFESLKKENKNIMLEIFIELWPDIFFIFNKISTDSDLVENIIQFIKIYIKGLDINFMQFIPNYLECIINGYKLKPISSYLYGFEILISIDQLVNSEQILPILNNSFNQLCQITLHGYIKNVKEKDDLIEIISDFYGLLFRILKHYPPILLNSELFEDIIKSGFDNYNNNEEIEMSKNIFSFFRKIISYETLSFFKKIKDKDINIYQKYKNIIQKKLENCSLLLCEKILKTFLDVPVESILEYNNDLLKDFIIYQKDLVINGMKYYIKYISNDILTNKEKEEFIFLIQNFETKEEEFDEFINNFENRCESKQIREKGKSN